MNKDRSNNNKVLKEPVKNQKKDIRNFIVVMVIFTIGMALMLIYKVSTWWIWYIYLALWTLIEYKIAKNIKLKWWWWALIIVVILLLDLLIMALIE